MELPASDAVPAFGRREFLAASGGSGPEGPRTRRTTPMGARFCSATVMALLRSMRLQQRLSLRASACSGCADLLVRFREKRPPRSGDRLDRRTFHGTTGSLRDSAAEPLRTLLAPRNLSQLPWLMPSTDVQPGRVGKGRRPGASERATADVFPETDVEPERVKRSERNPLASPLERARHLGADPSWPRTGGCVRRRFAASRGAVP